MEAPLDAFIPRCLRPKTLADFGYAYQSNGTLRHIDTGSPFKFISQKHYDVLGTAVVHELYMMLQGPELNLRRHSFPLDADPRKEPTCPIFASPNADGCSTVVILCQGSGAVRPGMWARALCMNDCLDRGSVFPYIRDAHARGWGVLVLNPNENSGVVAKEENQQAPDETASTASDGGIDAIRAEWVDVPKEVWAAQLREEAAHEEWIRGSDYPEMHMIQAYKTALPVLFPNVTRVFIVAHSYGGKCVTALTRSILTRGGDEADRLRALVPAIALTDAINDLKRQDRKVVKAFLQQRAINWVASTTPLDTPLPMGPEKSLELSAGHPDHIHTSESCRASVMSLFDHVSANVPVGKEVEHVVPQHCRTLAKRATSEGCSRSTKDVGSDVAKAPHL